MLGLVGNPEDRFSHIAASMSFLTATYYSYERYYYLKNSGSPDSEYGVAPLFAGEFSYYLGLKKTWLAFGKFSRYFCSVYFLNHTAQDLHCVLFLHPLR